MHIFLACMQSGRKHPVASYDYWERYFKRGIEEGGHTWCEARGVDWAEGLVHADGAAHEQWREQAWLRALDAIRDAYLQRPIDLFIGYLYPSMVDEQAIADIRGMGIPAVNFFCDNVREFRKLPRQYRCFDAHWVPEPEAAALYADAKCKYVVAPMPCWVHPDRRRGDHPESLGVTFIGSHDRLRRQLLGDAMRHGAAIDIAGPGWLPHPAPERSAGRTAKSCLELIRNQARFVKRHGLRALAYKVEEHVRPLPHVHIDEQRLHEPVWGDDYVRWTQQSLVTVGINRVQTFRTSVHRSMQKYSRLRDIEAPMMGACYLTEWTEGVAHFYDVGRDVETYRTAEELAAKLAHLRADGTRRRRLREAAQQRALHELSVACSIDKIAAALGIPSARPVQ